MISAINAIGSYDSWYLKKLNKISETDKTAETTGTTGTTETTETQGTENTQAAQSAPAGGSGSSMDSIIQDAVALAQKLGVSVSSSDELSDILDAISQALSELEAKAINSPEKKAELAIYQAEYNSLCQSLNSLQSSKPASKNSGESGQIETGLTAVANYNIAGISINKK